MVLKQSTYSGWATFFGVGGGELIDETEQSTVLLSSLDMLVHTCPTFEWNLIFRLDVVDGLEERGTVEVESQKITFKRVER